MLRLCTLEGCLRKLFCRGVCSRHYYSLYDKEKKKKYHEANRESILTRMKKISRAHYVKNKDNILRKCKARNKQRYRNDINYRIKHCLRVRLWSALRGNYIKGTTIKMLGCSIVQLKEYLQSKFTVGMSWDNYGYNGWHIDHIIPLCKFDLAIEDELRTASHYTNLQPLWRQQNQSKGGR